ncbi:MAG: Lrp/AsnC family transcriptional regulator [Xenococcaceae cyanobacterium]
MDAIDRQIIALLQANGRLTKEQIAKEVNLSRPAIHERLKRLEERKILRGYKALVDWSAIDLPLTAFISVGINLTPCQVIAKEILLIGDKTAFVEECHRVTGEWCLLIKVRAASTLALQDFLDCLRTVSGVTNTMTTIVLSTISET